ncbi:hypothetical protein ACFXO9_13910 [Nocardia tengchongensis]
MRRIAVALTLVVALSVPIGLYVFVMFAGGAFHRYHNPRENLPYAKDADLVVTAEGDCGQFSPTEPGADPRLMAYTGFYKVVVVRGSITCGAAVTVVSEALRQVTAYDTEFGAADGWNCSVADIPVDRPLAKRAATCANEATELVLLAVDDNEPR